MNHLPELEGREGLEAIGLGWRCGIWTSANGRTGFVPSAVVEEREGSEDAIQRLIAAGLWEPADGGYPMLRGPSSDPDLPLPLWRYGDGSTQHLLELDDAPNT